VTVIKWPSVLTDSLFSVLCAWQSQYVGQEFSFFSFCIVIPVKISLVKHSQINTYYSICVTALKFNFVLISCVELSFATGHKTHFYLSPKRRNWFFLCFVNGETSRFLYVSPIGRNILYHLLIS